MNNPAPETEAAPAGKNSRASWIVSLLFGAAFGFLITWGRFSDPDQIRAMLLLDDPYLYEMMFSAIAVGLVGVHLLRRRGFRSLVSKEPVGWVRQRPERRHIVGAATFGVGWAITDSCPGPIASQLAQGVGWALLTLAGVLIGIELFLRRQERGAPATDSARRSRLRPRMTSAPVSD